jgi:predicted anti-sigma-YlaC factor YlaD
MSRRRSLGMTITVGWALLAIAFVLFLLAAFGFDEVGGIHFVPLGLTALAGSLLADRAVRR